MFFWEQLHTNQLAQPKFWVSLYDGLVGPTTTTCSNNMLACIVVWWNFSMILMVCVCCENRKLIWTAPHNFCRRNESFNHRSQ
jgi:hypothetical protein